MCSGGKGDVATSIQAGYPQNMETLESWATKPCRTGDQPWPCDGNVHPEIKGTQRLIPLWRKLVYRDGNRIKHGETEARNQGSKEVRLAS